MHRRCHVPQLDAAGRYSLSEFESHHLAHVLRAKPGDHIELFDGRGRVAPGVIAEIRKRSVEVDAVDPVFTPPSTPAVNLWLAPPKGDRFDWIIEKATELGATSIRPLLTERSVVEPRPAKLDRLEQLVVAAGKQSRTVWLPEICSPTSWKSLWVPATSPSMTNADSHWLIADPTGDVALIDALRTEETRPAPTSNSSEDRARLSSVNVAIGPEGGWTTNELAAARERGARIVSLGDSILRIETAAIAALAVTMAVLRRPTCST